MIERLIHVAEIALLIGGWVGVVLGAIGFMAAFEDAGGGGASMALTSFVIAAVGGLLLAIRFVVFG